MAASKTTVTGEFDVTMAPRAGAVPEGQATAAMTIEKAYRGPLDGTATGLMLAVRTPVQGSAAYVAMEHVAVKLAGREGTFSLRHSAVMSGASKELKVDVIPDSGTGGLKGITGTMDIRIEEGKHFYDFTYELPEEA